MAKERIKLRKELTDAGIVLKEGDFYSTKFGVGGKDLDLETISVGRALQLAKGNQTRLLTFKEGTKSPAKGAESKETPQKEAPKEQTSSKTGSSK